MTKGQIMMQLREIKDRLKAVAESDWLLGYGGPIESLEYAANHLESARRTLCNLFNDMLAVEAHRMTAGMPFGPTEKLGLPERPTGEGQICPRCGTELRGLKVHDRGTCDDVKSAKATRMSELSYDGREKGMSAWEKALKWLPDVWQPGRRCSKLAPVVEKI